MPSVTQTGLETKARQQDTGPHLSGGLAPLTRAYSGGAPVMKSTVPVAVPSV